MEGGFHQSPLFLNTDLRTCEVWNEAAILLRADRLAEQGAKIWTAPTLDPAILQTYLTDGKDKEHSEYTLVDHPYLEGGITRELFDALRVELLALDECVREEILKLYIAYKAETNFVDVVPQAKRLRLSLNMDFPEIDDPRKLCKDVTGVGRWGNGDVEVFLEKLEDLPYIMGLVRQSLEKQLGDENDEP